jgi:methylenetetrahydrofolate dehydrogenase (NADP+)/methenyltetrahydrofolate cyclohydrolase
VSNIIDGLKAAEELKKKLFLLASSLEKETGIKPGLAVLRVGEDPGSQLYVQKKGFQAKELGYSFEEHVFPSWVSPEVLKAKIEELNQASYIHGIILQLPLPQHLDKFYFLSLINPLKDVDGLHPINAGKLMQDVPGGFIACTPLGCLSLIQTIHDRLEGLNVGIVGASILVGRPMAMLMLQQKCTIWVAHSKTRNLPSLCEMADILIVAIGRPGFIQGDWIRKGGTVIDVGINRLSSGLIVGDVDFEAAQKRAGAITPVPGGVGPMTVVSLLRNTLDSAYRYAGHPFPL